MTFERYQLVRPIVSKGQSHPAERVYRVVGSDLGGFVWTIGSHGRKVRHVATLTALPEDYTHEVWAKQPPLAGGAWQFEYGGRIDDCIRYVRMAMTEGCRIWEFSIRPLAFAYFTPPEE